MNNRIRWFGQLLLIVCYAFGASQARADIHAQEWFFDSYPYPTDGTYEGAVAYCNDQTNWVGNPPSPPKNYHFDGCNSVEIDQYGKPVVVGIAEWDSDYWGHVTGYSYSGWSHGYYVRVPKEPAKKGPPCDSCTGQAGGADPISIGTGNMYMHETDYASADKRLHFSRAYNSIYSSYQNSSNIGNGWLASPDARIVDIKVVIPYEVPGSVDQSGTYGTPADACTAGWAEIASHDSEYAGTTAVYSATAFRGMPGCLIYTSSNVLLKTISILDTESAYARPGAPITINIGFGVIRDDGSEYMFYCSQGTCFASDPTVKIKLSVDASGNFTLVDADGNTETYDSNGTLQTRTWKDGYQLSFVHGGSPILSGVQWLQSVTDNHGRTLSLSYDSAGKLAAVNTPDGATISYAHDANGRLTSVTNPTGTRTYQYTNASFPSAVTGLVDEKSNTVTTWTYDANGRATGSSDAGGVNQTTIAYNADGTNTVTDPLSTQRTYTFQRTLGYPQVTSISGPFCANCGFGKASSYDSNGYLAQSTDWNNNVTAYTFSAGLPTQRVDAQGSAVQRTTNLTWDTTLRNPLEQTVKDAGGNLQAKIDWMYNSSGEPLARCEEDPTVSGATSYTCSNTGTAPAGVRRWTYTYCTAVDGTQCPLVGLLLSATDPLGHATNYAYYLTDDSTCATAPTTCPHRMGDLLSATNALTQTATFTKYDGAGRLLSLTDPNGVISNLSYNARGWLTQSSVLAGSTPGAGDHVTSYTYDAVGQVTNITLPDNSYVGFTWDAAHRLTDVTDNLNNSIHYTLDNAGNRVQDATKDPSSTLKRSVLRSFNALDQLYTTATANATPVMTYGYDANGNPNVLTDGRGTITNNSFDALNRLSQAVQDPTGVNAITNISRDALDRVTQVKDPHGLNTQYQYDGLGNLTKLTSPDTGVTTYTYDIAGNRLSKTDARGSTHTATYAYDALNRLATITYPGTNQPNSAFTYDTTQTACGTVNVFGKGRLTAVTFGSSGAGTLVTDTYCYDRFGRVVQHFETSASGIQLSTSYAYDLTGRVTQVTTPLNTLIKYTRDAAGRITAVKYRLSGQGTDTTVVSNVTYYPYGPVASITYGNGRVLTRSYDQDYVVSSVSDPSTGGLSLSFGRDVLGNLTQLQSGSTGNNLSYDKLSRLTTVNDLNSALVAAYTYDGTGNRLSKQTPTLGTQLYTYPLASHQLIDVAGTGRSYDAAGNTTAIGTQKFVYDATNRLCGTGTAVNAICGGTGTTMYWYNFQGQRVRKALNGSVAASQINTVYDESGHPLVDFRTPTTANRIREYIWMDNLPVGVLNGSTGALGYVEPDHLGTPRTVIDAANNAVVWQWAAVNNPFGETQPVVTPDANFTSTFDLALRYPGQRYDVESGLNYNYFRNYDPTVGRYVESDPTGLRGGISTYAYVHGRPIGSVDWTGLFDGAGLVDFGRDAGVGAAFGWGSAEEGRGGAAINTAVGSAASSKLGESFAGRFDRGSGFSDRAWGSGAGELASTGLDALSKGKFPSAGDWGLAIAHTGVDIAVNAALDGVPGGAFVTPIVSNAINNAIDNGAHFDLGLGNFCYGERAEGEREIADGIFTPGYFDNVAVPGSAGPLRSVFGGQWWPW